MSATEILSQSRADHNHTFQQIYDWILTNRKKQAFYLWTPEQLKSSLIAAAMKGHLHIVENSANQLSAVIIAEPIGRLLWIHQILSVGIPLRALMEVKQRKFPSLILSGKRGNKTVIYGKSIPASR
jgi:hypothetical protein